MEIFLDDTGAIRLNAHRLCCCTIESFVCPNPSQQLSLESCNWTPKKYFVFWILFRSEHCIWIL